MVSGMVSDVNSRKNIQHMPNVLWYFYIIYALIWCIKLKSFIKISCLFMMLLIIHDLEPELVPFKDLEVKKSEIQLSKKLEQGQFTEVWAGKNRTVHFLCICRSDFRHICTQNGSGNNRNNNKRLSCCCNSRSYCTHDYDWLKCITERFLF